MKTKHTPGPWAITREEDFYYVAQVGGLNIVAEKYPSKHEEASFEEREEIDFVNAHLIAAAPELLEALKKIITPENDHWKYRKKVTNLATAAIAKAEGAIKTEEKNKLKHCDKCDGKGRRWSDTFGAMGDCIPCNGTGIAKAELTHP